MKLESELVIMDITYKKAKMEDAQVLIDIYNAAFYDDYVRYGECPGYGKTLEIMEKSIIKYPKYMILCDKKPVGVISCKMLEPGTYEVGCLCVIPEYQGKGIGTKAFQFALSQYADWERFTLVTPVDKEENVKFYTEKCGFRIDSTEMDGNVKLVRFYKERERYAIFFPGIGYHCDKPLLYYSRDIAYERGYQDYRNICYTYNGGNIRGNADKMQEAFEALYAQTEEVLKDVEWSAYDDILFVSKSIGTIIASAYAQHHNLLQVKHVLYTPLEQTFLYNPKNAIGFIGTSDPWSNVSEIVEQSKKKNIPLFVYEGANHSLETDDTMGNIDILKSVMEKTKGFL